MAEKLKERFAAADKNGDGKLSKEEAQAGMPFVYKHFDEIDKAHTGSVTMADIVAYAKQMRAAKQAGG
jgi:Ca2+-binding EF-hand superfamily protein